MTTGDCNSILRMKVKIVKVAVPNGTRYTSLKNFWGGMNGQQYEVWWYRIPVCRTLVNNDGTNVWRIMKRNKKDNSRNNGRVECVRIRWRIKLKVYEEYWGLRKGQLDEEFWCTILVWRVRVKNEVTRLWRYKIMRVQVYEGTGLWRLMKKTKGTMERRIFIYCPGLKKTCEELGTNVWRILESNEVTTIQRMVAWWHRMPLWRIQVKNECPTSEW